MHLNTTPGSEGLHPQGETVPNLVSKVERLQLLSEDINCKFIFEALRAIFYASLNTKT